MGQTKRLVNKYLKKCNNNSLTVENLYDVFRLGRSYGEYKNSVWNKLNEHISQRNRKVCVIVKHQERWTIEVIDDSEFDLFVLHNECKAWASLKALMNYRKEFPIKMSFIDKIKFLLGI